MAQNKKNAHCRLQEIGSINVILGIGNQIDEIVVMENGGHLLVLHNGTHKT